jgi:predicted amidohydrolase YtcJ
MILLSQNILTCKATEIGKTKVLLTVFRGHAVFKDPSF